MLASTARRRALAGLLLLPLLAAACGDDDDGQAVTSTTEAVDASDEGAGAAEGDVLEVAAAEGDLGMFLEATEAAGIMDGLHGDGPFTVFIPTDEAFEAYLTETGMARTDVFGDEAGLRRLLEHHILEVADDAEMVMSMDGQAFTTAAGTSLDVAVADDDTVTVGDATVERYDIVASNGVIHVIDAVLVPPPA